MRRADILHKKIIRPAEKAGRVYNLKIASQSSLPQQRKESNPFFGGACTCRKILCAERDALKALVPWGTCEVPAVGRGFVR